MPRKFVATCTEEVLLCGCKRTCDAPFCDGTHTNLPGGSPLDDPESSANRLIPAVTEQDGPRRWLNGGCYVVSPALAPKTCRNHLSYCYLVTAELGARFQTQILLEVAGGASPVLSLGDSDLILFVVGGSGRVVVSGRDFDIRSIDGLHVRPGEALQLVPDESRALRVFMLASPQGGLEWPAAMPQNFDAAFPERVVSVDPRAAHGDGAALLPAPRGQAHRLDALITQFIGHIPRSKAAPHRHLYEEAIIVLSGEGYIWTEERKALVRAGDAIFLPRKQLHSFEATSAEGHIRRRGDLPGDNPSIAYCD